MKNKQKGFTSIELIMAAVYLAIFVGWGVNLYKLTQCDFEAPYKAEVVRVIGLIPPIGAIVGWIDLGE